MDDSDTRRPEPLPSVRDALQPARSGAPPPARPGPARDSTPPPARNLRGGRSPVEPTRDVEVGEETWTIRVKGAATVGTGSAGTRILSVAFEGPGEGSDPRLTRYVLARDLHDVGEEELVSLVREVSEQPAPGSTRSERGGRLRGQRSRRRRGGP